MNPSRPIPHPHTDPLGHPEYAQIARAAHALRPVRHARRIAAAGGWFMLLAGLGSFPLALGSGLNMAIAAALAILGLREISLAKALHNPEPPALKGLAWNQIRLAIALTVYGVLNLTKAPPPLAIDAQLAASAPELASLTNNLARLAHQAVYATLILGAWIAQGFQAAYYARAARTLRSVHASTPMWVLRVHAAAHSGRCPDPALPLTPPQTGESSGTQAAA